MNRIGRRLYSTPSLPVQPTKVITKTKGSSFFGSLLGFLVGAAAVTISSQFHLLEEQERHNALIRSSVESIETSVNKTSGLLSQSIVGLEKRVVALESAGLVKSADLARVRGDLVKALESVHEEQVQIKAQLEQVAGKPKTA